MQEFKILENEVFLRWCAYSLVPTNISVYCSSKGASGLNLETQEVPLEVIHYSFSNKKRHRYDAFH